MKVFSSLFVSLTSAIYYYFSKLQQVRVGAIRSWLNLIISLNKLCTLLSRCTKYICSPLKIDWVTCPSYMKKVKIYNVMKIIVLLIIYVANALLLPKCYWYYVPPPSQPCQLMREGRECWSWFCLFINGMCWSDIIRAYQTAERYLDSQLSGIIVNPRGTWYCIFRLF